MSRYPNFGYLLLSEVSFGGSCILLALLCGWVNAEVRRAAEKCGFLSFYCRQPLQRAAEYPVPRCGSEAPGAFEGGGDEHQETSVDSSNAASHIYMKRGAKAVEDSCT